MLKSRDQNDHGMWIANTSKQKTGNGKNTAEVDPLLCSKKTP